jgi:hypothetical protein
MIKLTLALAGSALRFVTFGRTILQNSYFCFWSSKQGKNEKNAMTMKSVFKLATTTLLL